jgi:KDO2-lipid IV(A) lauroyltransferase
MVIFIKIIGFLISVLPVSLLEGVTNFLGLLLVNIPNKRKRIIFSNLKYAFPEWDKNKVYRKGRESAVRLIEMGFLSLSYSFFSGFRKRSILSMDQNTEDYLSDLRKSAKAVIFLIPHVCLFETIAISPFIRPFGGKRLGAIYRPNRNPELDQIIIKSRTTVGVKVFARDSALWAARGFLKRGNWLGLLFDQHSGIQGCHSYFLNRFASITTMPELLAKTSGARVVFSLPKMVGLFKAKIKH